MNQKLVKSAILGILSLQHLMTTAAQATESNNSDQMVGSHEKVKYDHLKNAERIIQKRIVGFDPKQAVETLTYLQQSGVRRFEKDGSVLVHPNMVQAVMETASEDGIAVRILKYDDEVVRLKLDAPDINQYDSSKAEAAKELASAFSLKCDMDGKVMF